MDLIASRFHFTAGRPAFGSPVFGRAILWTAALELGEIASGGIWRARKSPSNPSAVGISAPSRAMVVLLTAPPLTEVVYKRPEPGPPLEFPSPVTPGANCMKVAGVRWSPKLVRGRSSSSREVMVVPVSEVSRSSWRACAVTSTVSVSEPMVKDTSARTDPPTGTTMFEREYFLKPVFSATSLYVPGSRRGTVNTPLAFVVKVFATPVAVLVIVIVTPGTTAPLGSKAMPVSSRCG